MRRNALFSVSAVFLLSFFVEVLFDLLHEQVYGSSHPLGRTILGTKADIDSINRRDIMVSKKQRLMMEST